MRLMFLQRSSIDLTSAAAGKVWQNRDGCVEYSLVSCQGTAPAWSSSAPARSAAGPHSNWSGAAREEQEHERQAQLPTGERTPADCHD